MQSSSPLSPQTVTLVALILAGCRRSPSPDHPFLLFLAKFLFSTPPLESQLPSIGHLYRLLPPPISARDVAAPLASLADPSSDDLKQLFRSIPFLVGDALRSPSNTLFVCSFPLISFYLFRRVFVYASDASLFLVL